MNDEDFSIVALLDEQAVASRHSGHKVAPDFKRSYNSNPLRSLIAQEERVHLKKLSLSLKEFLRESLNLSQYGFFHNLLGRDWETKVALPWEFRDVTEAKFGEFLAANGADIKEKIDILREHYQDTSFDGRSAPIQEFISIPYNLTTREKILEIYEEVRQDVRPGYPARFFHPQNRRVPRILTRYLVDDVLCLPHTADLPARITPRDFKENDLAGMLGMYFSGNVQRALKHSYGVEEFPALYQGGYETKDVLRAVFTELDSQIEGRRHGKNKKTSSE